MNKESRDTSSIVSEAYLAAKCVQLKVVGQWPRNTLIQRCAVHVLAVASAEVNHKE